MAQITNYQCPNCTGPLHFDGGSGKLVCDYCNASLDVATVEQLYADKEQAAAATVTDPQWDVSTAGGNWSEEEAAHLRAYNCPSCGAQLICDDTTAATSCPYCGNPTVIPGQFTGQLKPDYVIPFLLDKNAAVEAMKKYYKGKKFLPKSFKSENRIEEIKGVYVPFWLFDGKTDAHIRFNAKNTKTYTSGDYEVTETDHYRVVREGQVAFEKVPADGSTKMPDAHMDAIEPFNYSELTPFSTAYLPGFLADKYDVDAEGCLERVNERFRNSTVNAFKTTTREYDSVDLEYADIQLIKGEVKYALLPVWLLSTKWKDQSFLFAMNGQTGKLVGDLPVDKGLVLAWFAGISLPLMLIIGAILFLGGILMKRLISITMSAFLFLFALSFVSLAADGPLVYDYANLFTQDEVQILIDKADRIAEEHSCDVALITIPGLNGGEVIATAEDYYDRLGLGYGEERSALLLLLSMEERDYAILPFGEGIYLFTDTSLNIMMKYDVLPLLRENEYFNAFEKYLDSAESILNDKTSDNSKSDYDYNYDVNYDQNFSLSDRIHDSIDSIRYGQGGEGRMSPLVKLGIIILLPMILAVFLCAHWYSQMKTAVKAKAADNYIPEGGFVVTNREDQFLYRNVTRRRIEKPSSSSSSSSNSSSGSSGSSSSGSSGHSGKF